ncbi:MAG: hypothetical protein CME61_07125 [Halobacteriovoraceae bacterium]|nr:hypothetical protein [Halobacteriovoraceae bacterium]
MTLISEITLYFLLSVSLGLSLFSILVNPKHTGAGFIKLINNVNIGSLMLILLIGGWKVYLPMLGPGAVLLALTPTFSEGNKSKLFPVFYLATVSCILASIFVFTNFTFDYSFLYILSGMSFLGVITYAMILGHWYLVVPGLSENHLKKAMVAFWWILGLKIFLFCLEIFSKNQILQSGSNEAMGYMFNWIMLLMRFGWGYLIIFVMGIYTWRLTKMRSIQSATGVLYVMTFFVFIGELIAGFYHFKYGISL